jgi:hypothetical protein
MTEQQNMPVDWASQMAAMANAEAKQEQPDLGTFSFKSGMLSFAGTAIPGSKIDVVVLGTMYENRYFPEEYDPDNIQSPVCWSLSDSGTNMVPDPNVTRAEAATCAECPQFQWDSDPKGRGGKACKAVRRFICIPATELENISGAHLAMGTLSTSNVKHWSNFVNKVAASLQRPSWGVIATLTCQPDQKTMVKVSWEVAAPIAEAYLPALAAKRERALELLARPYDKRADGWDAPKEPAKKRKY